MKTITISNEKGGVAKTTTSINLAYGLKERGFKVLAIDIDTQMNMSNTYGLTPQMKVNTIYDLLKGTPIQQCIYNSKSGVCLIFGDDRMRNDNEFSKEDYYKLKQSFQEIENIFDYCIIDTPPLTRFANILSLTASDEIIIPMQANSYSLQGLANTLKIYNKVKATSNPELKLKGILLTLYQGRTLFSNMTKKDIQKIANQFNAPVFKTPIRRSVKIEESEGSLQSILEYDPKSNVAKDYEMFVDEYLQEQTIKPEEKK